MEERGAWEVRGLKSWFGNGSSVGDGRETRCCPEGSKRTKRWRMWKFEWCAMKSQANNVFFFFSGADRLRAWWKKQEVSLPWHGFFVLQEATDTMNPAMLSRTVHVPSLKSSFSSFFFFNLLHLVALCHCQTASRREQGAEPLAADLCRLHFFFLSLFHFVHVSTWHFFKFFCCCCCAG